MLKQLNFKRLPFLFLSTSLVLASCGASVKPPLQSSPPLQNSPLPGGYSITLKAGETRAGSAVLLNDAVGRPVAPGDALSDRVLSDDDLKNFGIDNLVSWLQDRGHKDVIGACARDCPSWNFADDPKDPPVKMKLVLKSAEILDFQADNTALASENFTNNSSDPATFTSALAVSKTNSSTTSWSDSNSFTFSQSIKYQVEFLGTGGGGSTGLSYNHTWGEGGSETASTTIGTTSGVSVTLQPQQHVTATLSATQGTMRVRIVYLATLTDGSVSVYTLPPGRGIVAHGFIKLVPLLSAEGRTTSVEVTQDLDIGYFSGGKIEIQNDAGQVLLSRVVNPPTGQK